MPNQRPEFVQGVGGEKRTSDTRYLDWIRSYVQSVADDAQFKGDWTLAGRLRGSCGSASKEMQEVFPELILVRGTVVSKARLNQVEDLQELIDPSDGHIWLETTGGEIVDPTAAQFTTIESSLYIAFDESTADQLPTGKCPNCGDYCYNSHDFCSDECARSYERYMMRECYGKS